MPQRRVLEIGFGTGHNLPFIPPTVTKLLAVEPSGLGVKLENFYAKGEPKAFGPLYQCVATAG